MSEPSKTSLVTVPLTPEDIATAFCDMGSDEQAEFFAVVDRISRQWSPYSAKAEGAESSFGPEMQWLDVYRQCHARWKTGDERALRGMQTIGACAFRWANPTPEVW